MVDAPDSIPIFTPWEVTVSGTALLLIRLLLTLLVVAAAWRFGMRGVLAVLVGVIVLILLLKAGKLGRDAED
jgi:hypothetical protein